MGPRVNDQIVFSLGHLFERKKIHPLLCLILNLGELPSYSDNAKAII